MDLETTLICEYIFNCDECIVYLKCMNINQADYEHIYTLYDYTTKCDKKKKVRALFMSNDFDLKYVDLTEYINLMLVHINDCFNKQIILPNTVVDLDLGLEQREQILKFPSGLSRLNLCNIYKHKIPELTKLIELRVGCECDPNIKLTAWQKTLRHLTWYKPDQNPEIPQGLISLNLFAHQLSSMVLPRNLKYLWVFDCKGYISKLPNTITHLVWNSMCELPYLHEGLLYLSLMHCFDTIMFPNSLTHLLINWGVHVKQLPKKLIYLNWKSETILPALPDELEYLVINNWSGQCSDTSNILKLPDNLKYLKWACKLKLPILPESLVTLILESNYDPNISLPIKLTCLRWCCKYKLLKLPNTLITLELHNCYEHKLPSLPQTLTRLIISRNYKYINKLRRLYSNKMIYVSQHLYEDKLIYNRK
jgi:hypothetical protein